MGVNRVNLLLQPETLLIVFRGLCVRAQLHRKHKILALFLATFGNHQVHLVLVNTETHSFTNREKSGMFVVLRTDPVGKMIAL